MGSNNFQGVSNFFQGGGISNCLFPIETHITCDFPGGSGPPCPHSGSALVIDSNTMDMGVNIDKRRNVVVNLQYSMPSENNRRFTGL